MEVWENIMGYIYIYNEITIIPITMVYIKYQWYTISSLEVLELFGGNKI